jgi:hypothetical protein
LVVAPNVRRISTDICLTAFILEVDLGLPPDGVDLNTLFDELALIETQLKPFKQELEELGL